MATRDISSFFIKSPKEAQPNTNRGSTINETTNKKSPVNGKRKRSKNSSSSPPQKKVHSSESKKSQNSTQKPPTPKNEKDQSLKSFFNTVPKPKANEENAKQPKVEENGTEKDTRKDSDPVREKEPPKSIKKASKKQTTEKKVKSNSKKRSRIVRSNDSSDDELHLPLPESPVKAAENKVKEDVKVEDAKTGYKRIIDTDSSEDEDRRVSKSSKEEEKSSKNISSFFAPKKNVKQEIKSDSDKEEENDSKPSQESKDSEEMEKLEKDENKKHSEGVEKEEKPAKAVSNFFAPKQKNKNAEDKAGYESFNPSASKYHPIKDACWKHGEKVPYSALTRTLELIEEISARLKIVDILSNYFRSVIVLSPNDLLPSVYLCLNQLAPAHEGLELGIADTYLMKAIAQCTGRTLAQIKADMQQVGDLGLIAEGSRSNQKTMFQPAPLTVSSVYNKFKEIAQMTGQASTSKKVDKIQTLFVACRFTEARYLVRTLAGKLRIGLAEQSVLQALALACTMTPPEQSYPPKIINASKEMSSEAFKKVYDETALIIKTTYCECPNYNSIIPVLLEDGVKALPEKCKLTPGLPLKPMLAHPTKGVQEVLTRFDGLKFTCEWKYDGERAQIHITDKGEVSIFSRNQENNTSKYPDIIGRMKNTRKESVSSCILDCEAVAWDKEKKQILPFQILSTRKRKDANEADIKVQVCVFMFDLLYLNGKPLVKEPFIKRRELLKENFQEVEGEWRFATHLDTTTMEEVQDFLEESVKGNCEGLMVKTLEEEATYEIAKRSRNWLKLKKDYLEGVGDTLDVVVLGGYIGKGKRTGTYGGFLLACYDQENEEYQSLCKIGTGFSEEDLQKYTELFKEHVIPQPKPYYRSDPSHEPDHWFEPCQVWEIKCADLSLSPVHKAAAGIVDPEKGISLRFPRFIRIREDKSCEDATSAQQIADMYNNQEQVKNQASSTKAAEEDFY